MPTDLTELRSQSLSELVEAARAQGIDNANNLRRQDLIFEVARQHVGRAGQGGAEGVLEILSDGFGFLRWPDCSFLPGPDDIYVSPSQIRRFNLRTGDTVRGQVRAPKDGERYFALIKIEAVNGRSPDLEREKLLFDNLTPVDASRQLRLDAAGAGPTARLLDLVAPVGLGQRVRLLVPVDADRVGLLMELGSAITAGQPDAHLTLLLVAERPEEATAVRRAFPEDSVDVFSTTFDEPASRQVQVVEMAMDHVKRLVEQGKDAVVLVESLTAFARACQGASAPGGRELEGVADVSAMARVRRLFSSGRAVEGGGTLTLFGSVLTGTGDRLDELVERELMGCANVEVIVDPALTRAGYGPAIDVGRTRSDGLTGLLPPDEADRRADLRARFSGDAREDLGLALSLLRTGETTCAVLDSLGAVSKKGVPAERGGPSTH